MSKDSPSTRASAAKSRLYREAHKSDPIYKAKRRAQSKAYREKNPEKVRAYAAAYVARNIERVREYRRANWLAIKADPERRKAYELRKRFGIEYSDYLSLMSSQGGVCASCGMPPSSLFLSVDHCHLTGRIRGLLCSNCNAGIGLLGDDLAGLRKAVLYLERFG